MSALIIQTCAFVIDKNNNNYGCKYNVRATGQSPLQNKHPICLRQPPLLNTVSVSVNRVGLLINSLSEWNFNLPISHFPLTHLYLSISHLTIYPFTIVRLSIAPLITKSLPSINTFSLTFNQINP